MPETSEAKPQVAATGIAGVAGAMGLWIWNTWQGAESVWYLDDPVNGLFVAMVAFIAGPILRKYQELTS